MRGCLVVIAINLCTVQRVLFCRQAGDKEKKRSKQRVPRLVLVIFHYFFYLKKGTYGPRGALRTLRYNGIADCRNKPPAGRRPTLCVRVCCRRVRLTVQGEGVPVRVDRARYVRSYLSLPTTQLSKASRLAPGLLDPANRVK